MEFAQLGFLFSSIELQRIESARARTADERDFGFYSAERFLESLFFAGGRWRRSGRDAVNLAYRSAYIDFLCAKFSDRDSVFDQDKSDTPEAYAGAMEINADPNYLIYSRLDMTNESITRRSAEENERLIDSEVSHFNSTLLQMLGAVKSPSVKGVEKLLSAAAERFGISCALTGHHPRVVLETALQDDCSLYLEWDDDLVLRKWGKLQLVFSIGKPGEMPSATSKGFRCALDAFIPGGGFYAKTNGEILRIALSVLAHVEFMRIVKSFARVNPSVIS